MLGLRKIVDRLIRRAANGALKRLAEFLILFDVRNLLLPLHIPIVLGFPVISTLGSSCSGRDIEELGICFLLQALSESSLGEIRDVRGTVLTLVVVALRLHFCIGVVGSVRGGITAGFGSEVEG